MKWLCITALALLGLSLVAGCVGSAEVKHEDSGAESGFIKRQKDRALDVAAKENSYNRDGEHVAYGDEK